MHIILSLLGDSDSIFFSGIVELSSTGRAAERVGYILGKYEYVSAQHIYKQCACENVPWDIYIYFAEDGYFYVNDNLGDTGGWLRNGREN